MRRLLSVLLLVPLLATCRGAEPSAGTEEVRIVRLEHTACAETAAALARRLGEGGATVSPNPRTNSVIVIGSPAQVARALEQLAALDVPRPRE